MEKKLADPNLRLIVSSSALELGDKIDEHLLDMFHLNKEEYTFKLPIIERFFEDGHMKVELHDTVRGMDVYTLTDVCNYSIEYQMRGFTNHMSPNDWFTQMEDIIGACNNQPKRINTIMPLLYGGRQHRRNLRENLFCGKKLGILDDFYHVSNIITDDAHDKGVEHALRNAEFINLFSSDDLLTAFIESTPEDQLKKFVIVAPDNGAVNRRNIYLNSLNSEYVYMQAGSFVKQRDYNVVEGGKNPIIGHEYCGSDNLDGCTAIITDDMISSGGSMFTCMDELIKRGVKNIYVMVTFALFTQGIEEFRKYYEQGLFSRVFTTNLTYIPEEYKNEPWLTVCNCSEIFADLIYKIHNDEPISPILRKDGECIKLLEKKILKPGDVK